MRGQGPKIKWLLMVFAVLMLSGVSVRAANEEWVARYDGTQSAYDYAHDIAIDDSDNIYVTGISAVGATDWDYVTIKYDSSGNKVWEQNYDGGANGWDEAFAIAVDSSGDVYVTGKSSNGVNYDYATIKYDGTTGNQVWAQTYNGAGNGDDEAVDIAVDAAGNAYVTGKSNQGVTNDDYVTIKYATGNGAVLWTKTYHNAAAGYEQATAIAVDASNVYVTGWSGINSPTYDFATVKYNSANGAELWVPAARIYDGPDNDDDKAQDIVVDGSGNIYVTGFCNGLSLGMDCATVKYNSNGVEQWASTYDYDDNGTGRDVAEAIALDSSGNVYITGWSEGVVLAGRDCITIKYNPANGNELWVSRYNNQRPNNNNDYAYDITLDSSDNVYIVGNSPTSGVGTEYLTIKYDSAGNEKWVAQYNRPAPGGGADCGEAVAVDSFNNIYVTGGSESSTQHDYATVKYPFWYVGGECDWQQGDDAKWVQLPDINSTGIDVNASVPGILADDFECNEPGLITDIHIWGSWYDDVLPAGQMGGDPTAVKFTLSIHEDIPAADSCNLDGYSKPGQVLWFQTFWQGEFSVKPYAKDVNEGWMDPPDSYEAGADQICWQYNFCIDPCEAFVQQGTLATPVIYWLDVQAEPNDEVALFGWKTRDPNDGHFSDDAVWGNCVEPCNDGPWGELRYPEGHPYHDSDQNSIDMAFAITSNISGPMPEVNIPNPVMKWSQPPVLWNPNTDVNICGWDEESHNKKQYGADEWKIVADDFHCLGSMPVTSIHWWGSYYNWGQASELPAKLPIGWWFGFWSNRPKNQPKYYSWPKKLLHEFTVAASRVLFRQAGNDQFPNKPQDKCYEYYVDLEPEEVFWQDEFRDQTLEDTFWISIVAIYPNDMELPAYPWGWKTRPEEWHDDAVTFDHTGKPEVNDILNANNITPLEYNGRSYDCAFELDTDPNYIKWSQHFTQRDVNDSNDYMDIVSMGEVNEAEPNWTAVVADDWLCQRRIPVTSIVWWGSYEGYLYQANPNNPPTLPQSPEYFLLSVWTDVPDSEPCDANVYSHPGEKIWGYKADSGSPEDPNGYDEVLVGWDNGPFPVGGPVPESVFRYSVRLPEEDWFMQADYNGVFWLSVAAVYESNNLPAYNWGWTSHPWVWNDEAVVGEVNETTSELEWQPVVEDANKLDMCFVLFTDPNECSTYVNYNYDNIVNFIDYAYFAHDWRWNGQAGGCNNADLNCDGVVDFKDLRIFALQWLKSCP